MKTNKQIEGELGPDNAEARNLIEVLHKIVDTSQHSKLDLDESDLGEDEEFTNTGVGKDMFCKYSYAEVEVNGKEYFIQVRDKEQFNKIRNDHINLMLSDHRALRSTRIH